MNRLYILLLILGFLFACSDDPDSTGVIKISLPGRIIQPPEDLNFIVQVTDKDGIQSVQVIFKRNKFDNSLSALNKIYEPQGSTFYTIAETVPLPIEFRSDLYSLSVEVIDSKGNKSTSEDEIWVKEYITIEIISPRSGETLRPPYSLPIGYIVTSNTPLRSISVALFFSGSGVASQTYFPPSFPETFLYEVSDQLPFKLQLTEDSPATLRIEAMVYQYTYQKSVSIFLQK